MMKSKSASGILLKAALVAAFCIGGCATGGGEVAKELYSKPALKAADDRGQRLYDQAVKLHRRFAEGAKLQVEPFKSILTELSLYHEEDLATYLSDMGEEGKRSGPVEVAPWAQARLARFLVQLGVDAGAAEAWHQLGERFAERLVIEPADGVNASKEKAEPAALVGEIEAFLNVARKGSAKNLLDGLKPRIGLLQEHYGTEETPCGSGECPSYSRKGLEALWEALALEKADYKTWRKDSDKFIKNEKSDKLRAEILISLASASIELGHKEDSLEYAERAAKIGLKIGWKGKTIKGAFANLGKP